MKVILDNNAFIHLVENPQLESLRDTFFSRIEDHSITHVGTFEFIEELFLLYQHNPKKYLQLLNEYWRSVHGRVLLPWNTLIQLEVENRRCLAAKEKYLGPQDIIDLESIVFSPEDNVELPKQIIRTKENFKEQMNNAINEMLDELTSRGHSPKEIRKKFHSWYKSIDAFLQSWIESAFSIREVKYSELPHTKALFEFVMCRHYQVIAMNISHRGNDLYDRGYYVSAAETGLLVTDDKALRSTCLLIDNNKIRVTAVRGFLA